MWWISWVSSFLVYIAIKQNNRTLCVLKFILLHYQFVGGNVISSLKPNMYEIIWKYDIYAANNISFFRMKTYILNDHAPFDQFRGKE